MQPPRKPTTSKKLHRSLQSVQRRGRKRRSRQQRLRGAETKRTNVCIARDLYVTHATLVMLNITYSAFGHPASWPSSGHSYFCCWSRPQCMCSSIFSDIVWHRFSLLCRTFLSCQRPRSHAWISSHREVQFRVLLLLPRHLRGTVHLHHALR